MKVKWYKPLTDPADILQFQPGDPRSLAIQFTAKITFPPASITPQRIGSVRDLRLRPAFSKVN